MSTTTPNFGWVVPTSSDLVKNGAVAIETLGDSIDASMVDLKGGTTGQVLSKTSATDMDFTWTTASSGSPFVAGKNKVINADFEVWQRGTSFTAYGSYWADRWTSTGDRTSPSFTRQTFTPGAAPVAGYEGEYYARWVPGSGGTFSNMQQRIEDVRVYANQSVTLSYFAKISTGTATNSPFIIQNFGSGGSAEVSTALTTSTITTTWTRFTHTFTVPSVSGKTIGTSSYLNLLPLRFETASTANVDVWGIQLEAGSTVSDFVTASGNSPQAELAMCQRYYWRTANKEQRFGLCFSFNTTQAYGTITFPTQMRTSPSVMDTTGTAANYMVFIGATTYTNTSVPTIDIATPVNCSLGFANAGTMVAGGSGFMSTASAVSAYLGFSAEL
jgi:hypothetical protein